MIQSRIAQLSFLMSVLFVVTVFVGCGMQPRTTNDVTPPTPTRAPITDQIGNENRFDNRADMRGFNDDRGFNDYRGFNNNRVNRTNNNDRTGNNNDMRVADDIASRLTNMRDIDAATVFIAGNTAYVAVDMPSRKEGRLTTELKDRIRDEVVHLDSRIDNVYVSADADFFSRMAAYARDVRNGRPISGLVNEITESIRRVFPTAQ